MRAICCYLQVYNSLYTLIKDCAVLRDYCAAAVLIQQAR